MQQLPKLSPKSLEKLKGAKNLLAFSGGVDSSALFFLLHSLHVNFDIAHVNYNMREASNTEEEHAKELAIRFNKTCHTFTCKLESSNFEKNARDARYDFFDSLCKSNGYVNLITAHQLDDRLEWFMMQLCKGAGVVELLGYKEVDERENYTLLRPLLHVSKTKLREFLQDNNLPYFEDESNDSFKYKRNRFRHEICSKLLEDFEKGIDDSFTFLEEDATLLRSEFLHVEKDLYIFTCKDKVHDIRMADIACKKLGLVMSQAQRNEILHKDGVVSGKVAVGWSKNLGFIAPYEEVSMSKEFKESCRKAKIPKLIRPYMYKDDISPYLEDFNS